VRNAPPEPAPRVVPERWRPLVSRYERHRLVEVFEFEQPHEFMIRCTFHHQAQHARTFESVLDVFNTWRCGVCRTIGTY
jgi:hypothetical protein